MSNIKKYKNAFGYVRWSSDGQEEGNTKPRQEERIITTAKQLEIPLIKIFYDEGISALNGLNLTKEWRKMKINIKKGDVVLVENLDRITRTQSRVFFNALGEVVEDLEGYIVLTDPNKNCFEINKQNYQSDWNIKIENAVSSEESIKRIDRVRDAKHRKRQILLEGKWQHIESVNLPWWIVSNKDKQCFEAIPDRAIVIQQLFKLYNEGYSLVKLARWAKSENIVGKSGKIDMKMIHRWLRTKSVLGYLPFSEKNIKLYPPLIDEELFYQVQKKLTLNRRNTGPNRTHLFNPYKGLLKCCTCGSGLHTRYATLKVKHIFQCSNFCCYYNYIHYNRLDSSIRYILSCTSVLEDFLNKTDKPNKPLKVEIIKTKLDILKTKVKKIADLIVEDDEPSATLVNTLKELEFEQRKQQRELEVEEAIQRNTEPEIEIVKEFIVDKITEKWKTEQYRVKELLQTVIDKIIVDRKEKSYVIHWKLEDFKQMFVKLNKTGFKINNIEQEFSYDQ